MSCPRVNGTSMMLSLVLLLRFCPKVLRRILQNRRNRTVLADGGVLVIYFFVPGSFFFLVTNWYDGTV